MSRETAILGAGCFWGVQQILDEQEGVLDTVVGYTGGHTSNPTYKEVCSKDTGHAEVVKVEFDNEVISFEKLLNVFFRLHNPTTLNRQGPDIGSQYRSSIFYLDEAQKEKALNVINEWNEKRVFDNPIVTEVTKASEFYIAEDYHQKYFEKNPGKGCHILRPE